MMRPIPRFDILKVRENLSDNPHHGELLAFKNRSFGSTEDLIKATKDVLGPILNQYNYKLYPYPDYPVVNRITFTYLYEKFDAIYNQELMRLTSDDKVDIEGEGYDQTLLRLRDLIKCEQTIDSTTVSQVECAKDLVSLLEVFFCHPEHLDALLLLLAGKTNDQETINDVTLSHRKIYNFMAPFMRLYGTNNIDLLELWKNRKNSQSLEHLLENITKNIKTLLETNTQLTQDEIKALCEDIKADKDNIQDRRNLIQRLCKRENILKDEVLYYHLLGEISSLIHLQCLNKQDDKKAIPFLRMGIITNLYIVKYLDRRNDQSAPIKTNFDQVISGTNVELNLRCPSQILELILSELTSANWNDDFLQLLEFHLHVISKLHGPIFSLSENKVINCEKEYYTLFFQEELSNLKDKECLWRRLYNLITSNADNLIRKTSNYFISGSLYDSLLYAWVSMIDGLANGSKAFLIIPGDYCDSLKPEYYKFCLGFLDQIINLILNEKYLAKQLSKSVQNYLIGFGQRFIEYDRQLIADLDLEKIYGVAEKDALQYISSLENILSHESDSKLDENPNFPLILELLGDWMTANDKISGEKPLKPSQFIDKFMSSQLIGQLFEHCKGKDRWLNSIKDMNALFHVLQIIKFLNKMISIKTKLLNDEEKRIFIRSTCIWIDTMSLDFVLIPKIFQASFFKDIAEIFQHTNVFRIWRDKKFLFTFFRYALFLPKTQRSQAYYQYPFSYRYPDSEEDCRTLTQIFIKIVDKFEEKMRNPSIELWKTLEQLESELDKEEMTEEKTHQQQNWTNKFVPDLKVLDNRKLYEESVETVMQFLTRIQHLAKHLLNFQDKYRLRDIEQEVKTLSRKIAKMIFSPILMLAPEKFISEFVAKESEAEIPLADVAEGMCEGLINLCTEFGLTENLNIDRVKFGEMMLRMTKYGYIKPEEILKDLTWREAALASLYLAINQFKSQFSNRPRTKFAPSPEFSTKLKHASDLLLRVSNQIDKAQYEFFSKNEALSNFVKISAAIQNRISEWGTMINFAKSESQLTSAIQEIYLSSLEGLDLNQNKAHNLNIIKSFCSLLSLDDRTKKNITSRLLTNLPFFEKILSLVKVTINDALNCSNTSEQVLTSSLLGELDNFLNKDILNMEKLSSALGDQFEKFKSQIKGFLEVAGDFLIQADLSKVISQNDDSIITKVAHHLEFFEELLKLIRDFSKEKIDKVSQHIEQALSEADSKKAEELEKEKTTIREEYKEQIKKYLEAFLPHGLYFKDLKGSLPLIIQEFGSFSSECLIEEHDKIYKTILEFIWKLLNNESDSYLKGDLTEELKIINATSEKLALFDRTNSGVLNQAITLQIYLKYHSRFMDVANVTENLKISSNFVVGLVTVINSLLKQILESDLAKSQRDNQNLKIAYIIGSLIDYVGNLAKNYIVAQTITNLVSYEETMSPKQGSLQKVLLAALEMIDLSASINDFLFETTKTTILDEVPTCLESLLNLANSVLRSNKALRATFLNNGTLEKLLTTRKLKFSNEKILKSLLSLLATIIEANLPIDIKKVNDITNLQEIVSPIAQKCIQTLLKVLIQSYQAETESSAYFQKRVQKEKENKSKQKERLEKNMDDLFSLLKDNDGDELTKEEKSIPLRDVSLIVRSIIGIMMHQTYLVPYIMLQEIEFEDIHGFLKDTGKYTVLDVLMRIFLMKDGDCALLIAGSVIEKNDTEVKDPQGNKIQLKELFLVKILSIAQDLLDKEDALGQEMKTFESMLMRCNIGKVLAYLGSRVESDFSNKREETQTMIVNTFEKLLKDVNTIAVILIRLKDDLPLLKIMIEIVGKNMEGCLDQTKVKENHVNILRTIEEGYAENLKVFDKNSSSGLNQHVFRAKEDLTKKEIQVQEQQIYEKLEDKEQWQREETRKVMILAGIEKDNNIVPDFNLPESRLIGNKVPLSALIDFYGVYEQDKVNNLEERQNYLKFLDYVQTINDNLQSLSPPYPQTLEYPQNAINLPSIFRYSDEKYRKLYTNPIKTEETEDKNKSPPLNENVDMEKKQESDIEKTNEKPTKEEKPVEEEESKQEPEEENEEDSIWGSKDERIRYFYSDDIKSERHLKFKVNKALSQARALKESIYTAQTLRKLKGKGSEDLDIEEIVKNFTQKLTGFDRNVVYIGLGREIKETLGKNMRKTINKLEKVFSSIKEDFNGFKTALEEVKNTQDQANESQDQEASVYDDLEDELILATNEEEVKTNNANILGQEELKSQSLNKEISEETKKVVRSLKFSDELVLRVASLLAFGNMKFNVSFGMVNFAREILGPNPVNELRLMDTLLFVLYTPELLESNTDTNGIDFSPKKFIDPDQEVNSLSLYKQVVDNIHKYFRNLISYGDRHYLFLTPVKYLNKFGNRLLDPLKAKVNFQKKVSEYYSILDMVIGLLEIAPFVQKGPQSLYFLQIVKEIVDAETPLTLGDGDPQEVTLDSYTKYVSMKSLNTLFGFWNTSNIKDYSIYSVIEKLLNSFVNTLETIIVAQDCYLNWFSSSASAFNKIIEENIKTIKESTPNALSENSIQNIIENGFDVHELRIIKITLRAFSGVFNVYLVTEGKINTIKYQKVSQLLRNVAEIISKEVNQTLIVNIYELFETIYQAKKTLGLSNISYKISLMILAQIIVYYHSIITIEGPRESNNKLDFLFANFGLKYSHLITNLSENTDNSTQNIASSSISLTLLPKFPWISDFKSKKEVATTKQSEYLSKFGVRYWDSKDILVDRNKPVKSVLSQLKNQTKSELLKPLSFNFKGEALYGSDASKEFYKIIVKDLFDPDLRLFSRLNTNALQPNVVSSIIPYHLQHFEFAGLIIAKAIQGGNQIDVSLARHLLILILGKQITLTDLEDVDAELCTKLQSILDNEIKDQNLNFTLELEILGEKLLLELVDGGANTLVTEENKNEYVKKVCETRIIKPIETQIKHFMKGFHTIMPQNAISHLSPSELNLLITGTSEINIEEFKKFVNIKSDNVGNNSIKWFWEIISEFRQEDLAHFLYLVSGTSKLPSDESQKITILTSQNKSGLPIARRRFREIVLPECASKEELRYKLLLALTQ